MTPDELEKLLADAKASDDWAAWDALCCALERAAPALLRLWRAAKASKDWMDAHGYTSLDYTPGTEVLGREIDAALRELENHR